MLREVILDVETTGLDPKSGHRVIEVGCVELVNRFPSGKIFHRYLNPQRDVPSEVVAVHGISTEFLKDKPLFSEVAAELIGFLGDATLVIHNAAFDVGFLNSEFRQVGLPPVEMDRVVDTLMLARRKHPAGPNSLDALCKRYQIDNSNRSKHGALLDSQLLAHVYLELIGGHQAKLELSHAGEPEVRAGAARKALPVRPRPLPPRLTPAEAEAHRAFVAGSLKEALWLKVAEPVAAEVAPAA